MRVVLSGLISFALLLPLVAIALAAEFVRPDVVFDGDSMLVSLDVSDVQVEVIRDGDGYAISLDGVPMQMRPGFPKVPEVPLFVAVPPDAEVELGDIEAVFRPVGSFPVTTVPKPVFGRQGGATVLEGFAPYVSDDYAKAGSWPPSPVELRFVGRMRGLTVVRLAVYPVRVESRGLVLFSPEISFSLKLKRGARAGDMVRYAPTDFDIRLLGSVVANLDMAVRGGWFARGGRRGKPAVYDYMCKITTASEGPYVLDRESIIYRCRFPADLDPRRLALLNRGEQVDIYITGEQDGSLDDGDALIFWAERYEDIYTRDNAYILVLTDANGARMASRDATPEESTPASNYFVREQVVRRDRFYFQQVPSFVEDHWFAEYMIAPADMAIPFEVRGVDYSVGVQASVESVLYGASYPGDGDWDHHAVVLINDTFVDEAFWDGQQVVEFESAFDATMLWDGENFVSVWLPGDTGSSLDVVCPDYFTVRYPAKYDLSGGWLLIENAEGADGGELRFVLENAAGPNIVAFDVTDPKHPVLLENVEVGEGERSYTVEFQSAADEDSRFAVGVVDALPRPDVVHPLRGLWLYEHYGADYVIVAYDSLADAARRLAEFHERRGLDTLVVTYSELIDAFNHGIYGPSAIRSFLDFAYHQWDEAPSYVLLVGDGSYDYKDNYGPDGLDDFLSTVLIDDPSIGDTASDFAMACVDGDDSLPDIVIARLPAHAPDEVNAYVDKLERYYDSGDNFWRKEFLFVADDGFEESSYNSQSYVESDYLTSHLFISEYDDIDKLKVDLLDALNAGKVWVDYTGHGGVDVWAHEHILDYQMITGELHNEGMYPFVVVWTCLNGYFDHALIGEVIAEGFTLTSGAGAIGMFAPTRVSMGLAGDILSRSLYSTVFETGELTLGVATTAAVSFAIDEGLGIWAESYALFGDPAIELALPLPEDVNGSGRVDGVDLIYLCRNLDGGDLEIARYADIDKDGEVTDDDLARLVEAFGIRTF